jgi:ribonuclease HI
MVSVWKHPWLRNENQAYITTPMIEGGENMKVSELIDHDIGKWNVTLIQQLFNTWDAAEILKIPLNLLHEEDEQIWRLSRKGIYSVRSAYHHLIESVIDNNHLKVDGNWKRLWRLNVPNKVKIFLWRVLRGCLPVRGRLVQKGVPCSNKCPYCDTNEENEWHCFFGCNIVEEVWLEAGCRQQVQEFIINATGFVPMIFNMLAEFDGSTMSQIAMLLWSIWWRRKQTCWNEKTPTVFEVIRRARDMWSDWNDAQQKTIHHGNQDAAAASHVWRKPPVGKLKCNVDMTFYASQNCYCIAACLRDDRGHFVKAFAKRYDGQPTIVEAEALGVLESIKWLHSSHIEASYIETDCLHVVQSLNNRSNNNTEFGNIIASCCRLLDLNQNCKVSYVRRQANRVAHELAQATRFIASPQFYDYCPPYIETIIMNEMH